MIDSTPDLGLTEAHLDRLVKTSAVSPEVIKARGYRSATLNDAEYYKENGWQNLAKALPGLEIPLWTASGRSTKIQLRPDNPKVTGSGEKQKVQKYLFPAGETACIDVNPLIVERVRGLEPLFVTEGIIKADSAVSHGLVCVALMGVWNFRGQNGHGGSTTLPDWDEIALEGRDVYIVFDSDVTTKKTVQTALNRLVGFLANRGARVHALILPDGPDGRKTGLDDFFADGHSVDELMACAKRDYFAEAGSDIIYLSQSPVQYGADAVLYRIIQKNNEPVGERQDLCTFAAQVDQQIILDDGVADPRVSFRVSGRTVDGAPLPSVEVTSLPEIVTKLIDGSNPVWSRPGVQLNWGVKKVEAEIANCLRSEMGRMGVEEIHRFIHSGWREIDGEFVYLTAAGAITGNGLDSSVLVDLTGTQLEVSITEVGTKDDIRKSLEILQAGDVRVLGPLLAGAYAAPLRDTIDVAFSLHLFGRTGSFKTEIARVIASHFGRRVAQRTGLGLGSWMSTQNAIVMTASAAKDAIYVLDDLVPRAMNAFDLKSKTDVVFRSAGNASGRARMNRDAQLRQTYVPRCLVLSTGEDLPPGESVVARLVLVEATNGWISSPALSSLQTQAKLGTYERAMGAYISWLAAHYHELPAIIAKFESEPEFAAIGAGHARLPYNNRALLLGAGMYLLFAREAGAITLEEAREYVAQFRKALSMNAETVSEEIKAATIGAKFVELVTSRLARGQSHFKLKNNDSYTPGLEFFGWALRGDDYAPCGDQIGWLDLDYNVVIMKPDVIAALLRDNDIRVSAKQLVRELYDDKFLDIEYGSPAPPSITSRFVTFRTGRVRALVLKLEKLLPDFERDPSAAEPEPEF